MVDFNASVARVDSFPQRPLRTQKWLLVVFALLVVLITASILLGVLIALRNASVSPNLGQNWREVNLNAPRTTTTAFVNALKTTTASVWTMPWAIGRIFCFHMAEG